MNERTVSSMNKWPKQWHDNWVLDIVLRVGFIALLAWVAINLVLQLVPEEGIYIAFTRSANPTPCPE